MRNKCNLQLVNLIFRHHSVIAEVRNHLGTAAGAEADRWRAVRTGHVSQRHTAGSLELRTASGVLLVPEKKAFFFFTPLLPSCARNSPQVLTTPQQKKNDETETEKIWCFQTIIEQKGINLDRVFPDAGNGERISVVSQCSEGECHFKISSRIVFITLFHHNLHWRKRTPSTCTVMRHMTGDKLPQ